MKYRFVDIAEQIPIPAPRDLTSAEEADIIAEYKLQRTAEQLEIDYRDIDVQIANGVSADELLAELEKEALD